MLTLPRLEVEMEFKSNVGANERRCFGKMATDIPTPLLVWVAGPFALPSLIVPVALPWDTRSRQGHGPVVPSGRDTHQKALLAL